MRCYVNVIMVLVSAILVYALTEVTTDYSVMTTTADSEMTTDTVSVGVKPVDYTGAQILRVTDMQDKHMQMLTMMAQSGELEVLKTTHEDADILLKNDSVNHIKEVLSGMNVSYNVVVGNLQDSLQQQLPDVSTRSGSLCSGSRAGACFGWNKYYRLAEIYAYMDYLKARYPLFVQVEDIGYTFEKRPIKILKIMTTQPDNTKSKAIWVEGGIHAREWVSHAATTYIMTKVVKSLMAKNSPFSGLNYYFVPVLNPDGYEYTFTTDRLWRKNRSPNKGTDCVGTDLNRNWNYKWAAAENPCVAVYQGVKPFSELEIVAVTSYMSEVKGLQAYLTLHSYGQLVMFPWSHTRQRITDYQDLYNLAYYMQYKIKTDTSKHYRFGSISELLYNSYGSSVDWVRAKLKVKYAYAMELATDFVVPESNILDTSADAYAAFTVLAHKIKTGKYY